MGQSGSRAGGNDGQSNEERKEKKKSKYEQPAPTRVGKKKKKKPGPAPSAKVPTIVPASKCKLRLLKLERVKDYLLMEEEFVARQEQVKPQEESAQKERTKVEDIRGSPMNVASLEEMIDDNHAIVSSSVGPEYYVNIMCAALFSPRSRPLFSRAHAPPRSPHSHFPSSRSLASSGRLLTRTSSSRAAPSSPTTRSTRSSASSPTRPILWSP